MADRHRFWGWVLFLICALIFLAMGIRDGDILLVTGSTVFLAACGLFLWALSRR